MIIDSHTHADEAPTSGWLDPPEAMLKLMDEAGIDKAVIMTYVDARDEEPIDYISDSVARYPDRLVGYARIHPAAGRAEELLEMAVTGRGFQGLKLHPVSNLSHPADEATHRIVRKAAGLRVPVLFHCGDEPYTTPFELEHCAVAVPEAAVIFGHMGGYFHCGQAIQVAERRPNVYLETSAMPRPAMIRQAIDTVGAERVLFASDGPGCDPRLEIYKVERAGLSERERELIFSENILRLWAEGR
jgi:predicted TIM-barrel fold metal-dependent hydrolase